MRDQLTGLLNADAFRLLVEHELTVGLRLQRIDTLLAIDVDNLHAVNEVAGRDAGDESLRAIARVLRRTARESDIIGRIGDDEFAVYALDCAGDSLAKRIAAAIVGAADSAVTATDREVSVDLKIAITEVLPGEKFDELIERAGPRAYVAAQARRRRGSSAS